MKHVSSLYANQTSQMGECLFVKNDVNKTLFGKSKNSSLHIIYMEEKCLQATPLVGYEETQTKPKQSPEHL